MVMQYSAPIGPTPSGAPLPSQLLQFPGPGGGNGGGGVTTVDLGYGFIGFLDANGNLVDIRSAPQGQQGATWRPGEQAMEQQQLNQFDQELNARIQDNQATLAESRRQFDISTGLERERLAQQIRELEMQLANDMQIAQLDASTRLEIAGMERQVSLRGQDIGREQFAAGLGARKAEFAATALGGDVARQAIFQLGGSGGTTPLELAAQQFPQLEAPPVRSMAKGGHVDLRDKPVAIRVGEGGRPEIILASKNRIDVIPEVASAQGGMTMDPSAIDDARRTMSTLTSRAFEDKPMPKFGGLAPMEPFYGVQPRAPADMAFDFFRKPSAIQRTILSILGVRGLDAEETIRRMRAATPAVSFSGTARSR